MRLRRPLKDVPLTFRSEEPLFLDFVIETGLARGDLALAVTFVRFVVVTGAGDDFAVRLAPVLAPETRLKERIQISR